MTATLNCREAICQVMGWDFSDLTEYRYHAGRTRLPVYATPSGYVCATKNGDSIPQAMQSYFDQLAWVPAAGSEADYCRSRGVTVWVTSQRGES